MQKYQKPFKTQTGHALSLRSRFISAFIPVPPPPGKHGQIFYFALNNVYYL
jgi:hypothetical protein